jgi:hypothetical protein
MLFILDNVQSPGFDLTVVGEEFLLTQTVVGWKASWHRFGTSPML